MDLSRKSGPMPELRQSLLGCSTLRREIAWLAEKHHWPLDLRFGGTRLCLESAAMARSLRVELGRNPARRTIVCYGKCHPLIDSWIGAGNSVRTEGMNCAEMLLGPERYGVELAGGAFFLLEDLARSWKTRLEQLFGPNRSIAREIFRGCHSLALGIRTPCSGDFSTQAEAAATSVGLPLRWVDVSLDHLELLIQTAIDRASAGDPCLTK